MSFAKAIAAAVVAVTIVGSASGAFAGAALTTAPTTLYDGPVTGAAIVATVAPGARLGVLWCGMHGQWCLVTYHAKQGFVVPTSLKQIGGQVAVGALADSAPGGNGASTGGPLSSTGPAMHVVTGAGSIGLGPSSPGGTKPVANLITTIRH
jgi:hypothetical protein